MGRQQEQQSNKLSEHGISIDTPSSIVPNINFDTFTSTGLTPTATPVSGFSFPITSASTPGTLNTPMTNTAPTMGSRCSTQQRSSEVATGSVSNNKDVPKDVIFFPELSYCVKRVRPILYKDAIIINMLQKQFSTYLHRMKPMKYCRRIILQNLFSIKYLYCL